MTALLVLLGISAQYAQVKVYSDYEFENARVTVSSLANKEAGQFLSTDEKGTLVLKQAPTAGLQAQIDELKNQLDELRKLLAEKQSVGANANDFSFGLSPNPSRGSFDFEFRQTVPDELVIYDSKGAEIKTVKVLSGNTRVDMQQFSKGQYLVHIRAGGKTLAAKGILVE